jgi:polyisoprenoid-binding protein YceI
MLTRSVLLASLLTITTAASAQTSAELTLIPRPESRLTLKGTSTLHAFSCATSQLSAKVGVAPSALARGTVADAGTPLKVSVSVPVTTLKCAKGGKMDENMYKTLKADAFPTITYVLDTHEVIPVAGDADNFTIRTTGTLTVAGQSTKVAMDVAATRLADGGAQGRGSVDLKMTDFGIKPPVMMMGTLRVGNEIKIEFDVKLARATVVALMN